MGGRQLHANRSLPSRGLLRADAGHRARLLPQRLRTSRRRWHAHWLPQRRGGSGSGDGAHWLACVADGSSRRHGAASFRGNSGCRGKQGARCPGCMQPLCPGRWESRVSTGDAFPRGNLDAPHCLLHWHGGHRPVHGSSAAARQAAVFAPELGPAPQVQAESDRYRLHCIAKSGGHGRGAPTLPRDGELL